MANNAWSNDSITTLIVPTGATSGARVVIDGITGTISVYNNVGSGNLVGQWGGPNGSFTNWGPLGPAGVNQGIVEIFNGEIFFQNTTYAAFTSALINLGAGPAQQDLFLESGKSVSTDAASFLLLQNAAPGSEFIQGSQKSVQGGVMQTDSNPGANLTHTAFYSLTWNTAPSDVITFNHGCSFTPTFAEYTWVDGSLINYAWIKNPNVYNATTAQVGVLYSTNVTPANGDVVQFNATFYG